MKKIVFDLDGTLLFLANDWESYYQKFINKYNLNVTPKTLFSTIGTFERYYCDKIVTKETLIEFLNEKLSTNMPNKALDDFFNYYASIKLLDTDNISKLLEYLSSKYELIAYSNWYRESQIQRLKKYNLDKFFTKIYGCETINIKPSIVGIKKVIENNNIKDYIFVGDNIEIDLEVPNNMGMDTIFFNRKGIKQDKYKEVSNILDLMKIL